MRPIDTSDWQVPPAAEGRGHGSPFDRGQADAYYGRAPQPHRTERERRVEGLQPDEVAEYLAGYASEGDRWHHAETERRSGGMRAW